MKRENTQLKNQVNGLVKLFKATWRYFIDFLKATCDDNQNSIPKTCITRFLSDSDRTDEKSSNIVFPPKVNNALDDLDRSSINETDVLNTGMWEKAKSAAKSITSIFGSFFDSDVASSSEQTDKEPKQPAQDVQGEFDEIPLAERSNGVSPDGPQ